MFDIKILNYEDGIFKLEVKKPSGGEDSFEFDEKGFKDYIKAVKDYCKKGYRFNLTDNSNNKAIPKWINKYKKELQK